MQCNAMWLCIAGPLKSEPVVSSAVVATSRLPQLLLLLFLFFIRLQVLVQYENLIQKNMYKLSIPRTSKASEEYQCDKPRDIGHRCDNCKATEARLYRVQWENCYDCNRLIRGDNFCDRSVETISAMDPLRQFLRSIRWDNFCDRSAETISMMRRMMTSEGSHESLAKMLYRKVPDID